MKFRIEGDKLIQGARRRLRCKKAGNQEEVKVFKAYRLIVSKAVKEHVNEDPGSSFKEAVTSKAKCVANSSILKRDGFQTLVVKENLTRLSVAEAIQRIKDTHGLPNTTFTFDEFINKLKRNRVINQQSDLTKICFMK